MEFWNHVDEGKGLSSAETVSVPNSLTTSRNASMNWELRDASILNENFEGMGFPEIVNKQVPLNPIGDVMSSDVGGRLSSTMIPISSAFSGDDESPSRLSSSVLDSASRDSSLVDLKLGRFPDHSDLRNSNFSKGTPMMSSSKSSTPAKRARGGGENFQNAYCQVLGCGNDLSSSKDYHRRHKVCEAHSKTSKVIVNGIEQRFCQQCSRFHLLAEFDDGKRSCRKRLAGHNERRRKPQVGIHSGRSGRVLQSYNGSNFRGTASSSKSFVCQDILPNGFLHSEKYGVNTSCGHLKLEGADYNSLSTIAISNGHPHSRSVFPYGFEKQFSSFSVNRTKNHAASIFSDSSNKQYPNDLEGSGSGYHSLFQDALFGSHDYSVFDSASTVQELSGIPVSDCALSLLSSQSQNSSSHSSGIPMAHPMVISGSDTHYSMRCVSDKFAQVNSQASRNGLENKRPSPRLSSSARNHLGAELLSESENAVNFEIADGIVPCSEFASAKDCLSCEDGPTINLLQLSSQLQRVQHQRQSMQLKRESGDTFGRLRFP